MVVTIRKNWNELSAIYRLWWSIQRALPV